MPRKGDVFDCGTHCAIDPSVKEPLANHWHIYPREQLKPALTGKEIYVLAMAEGPDACVKSCVGRCLRHNRIAALPNGEQDVSILTYPYGIVFEGVNKRHVKALAQASFPADLSGFEVTCHNKQVISKTKAMLLSHSFVPENIDALTFCLVQGLTHLLPSFKSSPRLPDTPQPREPMNDRGILIVEDCKDQRELFRLLLEQRGYCNIFMAQDGTEALPILEAQGSEIDLILLNWQMPRMDGLTFLRHLQGYPHTAGVIMESGYPHHDYKKAFFSLGTDSVVPIDYLVKPFQLHEFDLEVSVAMEYVRRRKLRRA
jgi:CheY-like chemotaxis protein